MSGFNRGEWSELLTVLYLSSNPKIKIIDENLNFICDDIFIIKEIVDPKLPEDKHRLLSNESSQELYWEIVSAPVGTGSFSVKNAIHEGEEVLKSLKTKSKSSKKSDLTARVEDSPRNSTEIISYSIKSMLGSPATLLNASSATNFEYTVQGLDKKIVKTINEINTRTKLLDRLKMIYENGGTISFSKVVNKTFEDNLVMVDSKMPEILGEVLLKSYSNNTKDLLDLFLSSNQFRSKEHAMKKLDDLLQAISFGMFPKRKWNGKYEVNGGILIVKQQGDIGLLDLIYHGDTVTKFLTKETKLDSPSTSRYHMLELQPCEEEKDAYKFTLNLQIRYKH